ncbi:helix-turn-helix transcriptional regulator [Luteimonas sp. Y-2-2-4F]|nr:helix-turn-helix transcriptional regulator [Luteimonas sp. Y-2-2-4F]MCD9033648.1 helix-turn-helix transcriptional regulator [Luteimonas sp. Y-2-2-4F]
MLDNSRVVDPADSAAAARTALLKSLDMADLWRSCASLVTRALPCHSCSLMLDIDGYAPQQGHHVLAQAHDSEGLPVTSLDVAAPFLDANPRVRWYTFSQIVSQDALAAARLRAQNPAPGWREFIHMAFWNGRRLEAVLSIRIRAEHTALSAHELAFLMDLYPVLDASLQRVRSLESERIRHRAFEALLYRLPLAAAIVDDRLSPLYVSADARKLLAAWPGATRGGGRLPLALERAVRHALPVPPGAGRPAADSGSIVVPHPGDASRALRVAIGAPLQLSAGRRHFILTFVEESGADAAPDAFARAMPLLSRLSHSERKVAALVASGLRNHDIACRLCRSRKTIESQISSIYRKLDIGNRAQLVRLLAG